MSFVKGDTVKVETLNPAAMETLDKLLGLCGVVVNTRQGPYPYQVKFLRDVWEGDGIWFKQDELGPVTVKVDERGNLI